MFDPCVVHARASVIPVLPHEMQVRGMENLRETKLNPGELGRGVIVCET